MSTKQFYIAWNAAKSEGAVFNNERDAKSAIDGEHRFHPDLRCKCISSLAESFFETYGEDQCSIEAVNLPVSES